MFICSSARCAERTARGDGDRGVGGGVPRKLTRARAARTAADLLHRLLLRLRRAQVITPLCKRLHCFSTSTCRPLVNFAYLTHSRFHVALQVPPTVFPLASACH